ncbi:hypothetical protein V6N11_022211 [Hibiscus sabdariffa]|uniref:RNase H type-1 domain-containing protein n=1 Tax=Hibiscus sabdariffa TaxID=183260 RepID=A0ABR2TIU8_9ROSI
MTSSGSWDPSLLLSILPEHAVNHILSYRCPNPNDLKDFYRWRWNPQFTISEAYAKLMEEGWNPVSKYWYVVWTLSVPQRIRVFLWLVLKQKLMTNLEHHHRGLSNDFSCKRCGSPESHIWKSRNAYVFSAASQLPDSIARLSLLWSKHFRDSIPPSVTRPIALAAPIQWNPPPPQWICLNIDGSVCPTTRQARIRGLFRDATVSWIEGFGRNIGNADAFTAELWAVFEGLTIAKQLGFKLVQIQSDCSKAISEFMGYKLIMLICIHPHSSEASICSDNMLGSSNSFGYPADARVKLTPPSHFELIRYTNPQNLLCDLLDRDISGPPYYRSACN